MSKGRAKGTRAKNVVTGLTALEETFVAHLAKGLNQSAAYRQAFPRSDQWRPSTVHAKASSLAACEKVQERFRALMTIAAKANEVDLAMVLKEYLMRVRADPRELSAIRIAPCRYCRGVDHLYQYTDGELRRKVAQHEDRRHALIVAGKRDIGDFDKQGGGGFNVNEDPNLECPACGGAGEPRAVLGDSRKYSPEALALFVSAKEGKEGIEVKVNDRDAALAQVARHVGFFEADKDPAASVTVNFAELDAIYDRAMAESKAAESHAKGRMQRLREAGVDVGQPGDVVDGG